MIPGAIAYKKGHDFFLWWLFGAALFIVALQCAIVLDEKAAARRTVQCPHWSSSRRKPVESQRVVYELSVSDGSRINLELIGS